MEEGSLTFQPYGAVSGDLQERTAEHTDFQPMRHSPRFRQCLCYLSFCPCSQKRLFCPCSRTRVICTSFRASSRLAALCQDHTSLFPSVVLFHQRALSKWVLGGFSPVVPGHPPLQPSLRTSSSSEYSCTSGNPGHSPCAGISFLEGDELLYYILQHMVQMERCIPEMPLMC